MVTKTTEKYLVTIMVLEGQLPHAQYDSKKVYTIALSGKMHETHEDAQKEISTNGVGCYQVQKVFVVEYRKPLLQKPW